MTPPAAVSVAVRAGLAAVLLAGCAMAPSSPPTPITDMRQIEGKWQGTITVGFGGPMELYYLTIYQDGRMVAQWGMNWQQGQVTLSGGTATFEMSNISDGTLTYYTQPKRQLTLNSTFGNWSAQVNPVE
ncbi:MAG TPA: hypothetical protein VMS64_28735 [Candidatus Methylomirabilis sp.]|nr:hypothetical protein [Candidatus Methylomirabilis sp.]